MNKVEHMVRETTDRDLVVILSICEAAFDSEENLPGLVKNLFEDETARPFLSLLAFEDKTAIGHILFTHATIGKTVAALLAPLAVIPEYQNRGIGGRLIQTGCAMLKNAGVEVVFVLGYPDYYQRHGFVPAGRHGMHTPFPIPEQNADAWMVRELVPDTIENICGILKCADAINRPEYWRE
ncbi:MAG: N-acetyltransferase [Candidatus Dadabacteria bacterium]|nr:N-acetyltransferase [Candidatus Dadabacteria bacterium]